MESRMEKYYKEDLSTFERSKRNAPRDRFVYNTRAKFVARGQPAHRKREKCHHVT